ncbi:MAG: twin-arginine translocase TatA/TatE family subunit [Ignavibacteriales bacterium]|nr:twin-arginine translocase TatA/TatE family subunit [Ignavibacteriales bacterium]
MLENIGFSELLFIVVVIVVFFGPKKIPEIARMIGKASTQVKRAMADVESELKRPFDNNDSKTR